jgi:Cu(I)/Ag(I) efflux system membrane fusion protein
LLPVLPLDGASPNGAGHLSGSAANVTVASAPTERKVLYWYDPMVPTQKFDKPGKSPYMDMPLMPKYADEDTQDSTGLSVSAQAVQALGLRTAEVLQGKIGADVNVVGTVLLNDRDVSIVQARTAGFVERVYARAAGDVIAAGAPLADLLLPEWWPRSASFSRFARWGRTVDRSCPPTAAAARHAASPDRPGGAHRRAQGLYTVTTPQGGLVAELMVRQGMTVSAGASLAA